MNKDVKSARQETLNAIDYFKDTVSKNSNLDDLSLIESVVCHYTNFLAGTSCHETCTICQEEGK